MHFKNMLISIFEMKYLHIFAMYAAPIVSYSTQSILFRLDCVYKVAIKIKPIKSGFFWIRRNRFFSLNREKKYSTFVGF